MCGIAGSVSNQNSFDHFSQIRLMLKKIKHRGPDDEKILSSENFCGGYVRLSITTLKMEISILFR